MVQSKLCYDLAVVGGSLHGVISALRAASAGLSVVVVEKNVRLGGAWGFSNWLGHEVPYGPHFLKPSGKNYRNIEKLGFALRPLQYRPDWSSLASVNKLTRARRINWLSRFLDALGLAQQHKFFLGGVVGVSSQSIELLSRVGVVLSLSSEAIALHKDAGEWQILVEKNSVQSSLIARQVVLSPCVNGLLDSSLRPSLTFENLVFYQAQFLIKHNPRFSLLKIRDSDSKVKMISSNHVGSGSFQESKYCISCRLSSEVKEADEIWQLIKNIYGVKGQTMEASRLVRYKVVKPLYSSPDQLAFAGGRFIDSWELSHWLGRPFLL